MATDIPVKQRLQSTPRILTVQSHVVSGYCGNKSATFPLQLLEFEVDVVNSVQLSNHTQYTTTRGQIYQSKDLNEIHQGLRANNLTQLYDIVLSGYVADVGYIEALAALVRDIRNDRRQRSLDCCYTLDPVLGDDATGYYVPNGHKVAEAYKKYLVPMADIITPNRFEATILSGVDIDPSSPDALEQAMNAINSLHDKLAIRIVVLTSLEIATEPNILLCIVSHNPDAKRIGDNGNNRAQPQTWLIKIPKLELPFTGTGDLFTALFTGWLHKTKFDFKESLENTANTIHDILEDTLMWYNQSADKSVQAYELRLVQNRDKIVHPSKKLFAQVLDSNPGLST